MSQAGKPKPQAPIPKPSSSKWLRSGEDQPEALAPMRHFDAQGIKGWPVEARADAPANLEGVEIKVVAIRETRAVDFAR